MTIPNITALPTAPSRSDPQNFSSNGDVFFSAIEKKLAPELNAAISEINTTSSVVDNNSTAALIAAQNAAAAQSAAALTSGATPWVSGTTYALNSVVISQANFQTYRKKTGTSVSNTDPSADTTNWTQIGAVSMQRFSRTANTILSANDRGKIIDIDSGTFTQTFSACSTLGVDWYVYLRNNGSGDITLDPSGSELIDGLTTYIMYPGECRLIQCNGTDLKSIVLTPFCKTFTASGTFVKPPGYAMFEGYLWGGGGAGGRGGVNGYSAAGGGGGACAPFSRRNSQVAASTAVTIGSGGVGGIATGQLVQGAAGGNSSWGGVTAFGGIGGGTTVAGKVDGPNGGGLVNSGSETVGPYGAYIGSNGYYQPIALPGFGGGVSTFSSSGNVLPAVHSVYGGGAGGAGADSTTQIANTTGGNSHAGGAGGGGAGNGRSGAAGASGFGGNGGAGSELAIAGSGALPGGGGGATITGTTGSGANGQMIIWGK